MRLLRLLAGLVGCAVSATAQLAPPQPSEKFLVATLTIKSPADSAMDIAVEAIFVARRTLLSSRRGA